MLNVVNSIDNTSQPYLYRGEDCLDHFVNKLREIKKNIFFDNMNVSKPMDITDEQEAEFRKATVCSICNNNFKPEDIKVRDHCHFTGMYRGCAHETCNLDYSFRYFKIPVFFHNSEKCIPFSFGSLQFKDSIAFLSASLDKLVKLNKYDIVGKDEHDKPIYKKNGMTGRIILDFDQQIYILEIKPI